MSVESLDTSQITKKITEVIVSKLEVNETDVSLSSHYIDDLGADSLDVVDLFLALEEEFKEYSLRIPDEEAEKLGTVGETVTYIEDYLKNN